MQHIANKLFKHFLSRFRSSMWRSYHLFISLSVLISSAAVADTITFDNFSQSVSLVKKQGYYVLKGSEVRISLSNRLIVKTSKNITKQSLKNYHKQITQVSELFVSAKSRYYSVVITTPKLLGEVLSDLQKNVNIELIQPDMLQLKNKSELKNTLDNAVTNLLGEPGLTVKQTNTYIDLLGLPSLWEKTKGAGVKIAIIDDGFHLNHPDLQQISPIFSYDVTRRVLTSQPVTQLDTHGTKVAGIILAAHNNIGIDGIAPDADLIALRQPDSWTSNTLLSFQLAKLSQADIINCSWHSQWLLQPIAEIVTDLAITGREGKGAAVIFASGNQGRRLSELSSEASIGAAIVVGASGQNGKRLAFSNYGDSIDFLNFGKKSKTTVISGYYGQFSGTSLASTITSGVAALILSLHPELTLQELIMKLTVKTQFNGLTHEGSAINNADIKLK